MPKPANKSVPRSALRLRMGVCQFTAGESTNGTQIEAPISIIARSNEPTFHPYWGQIVHDMAGMKLRKDRCPLDYCHWEHEPIGFGDKFEQTPDGLRIEGKLISFREDDRAAEIIYKAAKGVPYEASIDFADGQAVIEEIPAGVSVQVNGYAFTGPGVVVRQWSLVSVAVCPFGADPKTKSDIGEPSNQEFSISIQPLEVTMSTTQTENSTSETPKGGTPEKSQEVKPGDQEITTTTLPPAANPEQLTRQQMQRFVAQFGADNGTKWFFENHSFESAMQKFSELQSAEIKTLRDENAQLKQRLSVAKPAGEEAPISAGDSKSDPKPKQMGLSDSQAKFASSIKLPGRQS